MTTQQLNISLDQLGLTPEALADRVVELLAEQLTTSLHSDDEGNPVHRESPFIREMQVQVKKAVDAKVQSLAEKHILPRIEEMLTGIVLQKTNDWGEKKGDPVTLVEYLVERADAYLREPTDHWGKARGEPGTDYNWKASTTRIAGLIDKHLSFTIDSAMKKALAEVNASIVGGLEAAVKIQLGKITEQIKVVSTNAR